MCFDCERHINAELTCLTLVGNYNDRYDKCKSKIPIRLHRNNKLMIKKVGWCYYDWSIKRIDEPVPTKITYTDPLEYKLKLNYFNDPLNEVSSISDQFNFEALFKDEYRFSVMRFQIFEYKNFMGTAAYADENISKGTIVYAILEGDVVCLNKDEVKGIRTSGEYFIPLFKSFSEDFPWVFKFNNTLGMQKSILRKEMCGFSLDHLETNLLLRRVPGKDHRVTIIYQAIRQINKYELFVAEDEDRKTIGY